MKTIINNLFQGIFSEFGGKALFEWGKEALIGFHKDRREQNKTYKKSLENAKSRVTDAFLELGDLKENKLFQLHKKAAKGELRDTNGKKISDDNLIYLLGKLDADRLKSTIRALNKYDEETLMQFIEMWDDNTNLQKFMLLTKKCWGACCEFIKNAGLSGKLSGWLKKIRTKCEESFREFDGGTDEAISDLENYFHGGKS